MKNCVGAGNLSSILIQGVERNCLKVAFSKIAFLHPELIEKHGNDSLVTQVDFMHVPYSGSCLKVTLHLCLNPPIICNDALMSSKSMEAAGVVFVYDLYRVPLWLQSCERILQHTPVKT